MNELDDARREAREAERRLDATIETLRRHYAEEWRHLEVGGAPADAWAPRVRLERALDATLWDPREPTRWAPPRSPLWDG